MSLYKKNENEQLYFLIRKFRRVPIQQKKLEKIGRDKMEHETLFEERKNVQLFK
jgi:hypothetical protein